MKKPKMYHLTHNYGKDPWCGAPGVNYECGLGSVLVSPNYWCEHCRNICVKIHNREPGTIIDSGEQILREVR